MKKLLPLLLLLSTFNLFSQKEANFWYFGENIGLNFNSNPPINITGSLSTDEGSASISDNNGVLQFYTDGTIVYNRNGTIMPNGTGLLGDSSSAQSAIIVPKPNDADIYYLFTVGNQTVGGGNGVHYSEIDMRLNGGLGDVSIKNIPLNGSGNAREKITSVIATDCNTFWVITSDFNNFYTYRIDSTGVNTNPTLPNASHTLLSNLRGYLKLSPNGKVLVNASANSGSYIYDFDPQTGLISNERILNLNGEGYGVEFSRDSKQLYITTGTFSQISGATGERNPRDVASIQKFNLDSDTNDVVDNINSINLSRETIYITNSGYRGALQLAGNGKIYYARSRETFLGVINNPENPGTDVDFVEQGLSLDGRICTEGLPPFIQSFFLPIEITDQDTGTSINNQNLQLCIGDSKIISPDVLTGVTNENYIWSFDDGTTTNIISNSPTVRDLTLTNIDFSAAGEYNLKITLTDNCGNPIEYNATFNIEVFEAAIATKPVDINFCDTDGNGFNSFDLQAEKNSEILNGLDSAIFDVVYFESFADANTGVNPLPNPYTNKTAFSSETIYARVQNKNAPNACIDITDFTLTTTQLPIPKQPEPYRICDDLDSGSDTDGIIKTFLLSSKDNEIYDSLDATQFNITYHTTQVGAETNDPSTVVDKDTNYTVTNSKTLFIRIENKDNTGCFDANATLDLIVDPLPTINQEVDLLQCDDDLDRVSTINLTEAEISISNNYENETFEYFATEADAIAGTPLITDELRYPVNQNGEAWVRVISNQNCYRISKINLEVEAAADVAYNREFPAVCDDFLQADGTNGPANNDTDGITNFNFSTANIEILAFFPSALQPDLEIRFYETRDDRTAVINEIQDISNYRNVNYPSDVTRQTIYFKITNKNNNNCSGTGELYLKTDPVPVASNVPDLELCDDVLDGSNSNGFIQSFDLESKTSAILNGQNPADFTVTYHLTSADANVGTNAQSSPFTNILKDTQTIYVRVTDNNTGCFTDHTSFNVIVNPVPIANFVNDLEICDDNSDGSARNGFSQSIDLESQTDGILGSQDSNIYEVTYHRSLIDAQTNNNPLVSPYSNLQPGRETIYVRINNTDTDCVNDISNFDVIVNPEPIIVTPTNLPYCDDDLDGDDSNGIVQNIDLDSKIIEILGTSQDPDDYNVTFHLSQNDASTGTAALILPYQNSNPTERIYVRVQNKQTMCVNDDASFEVIVNPLPNFTVTTPQILCLNNLPFKISVENPVDNYTYVWTDENGNLLNPNGSVDNIDISKGGNYKVTATTTDGTMCSREENIIVNESNVATLEPSFVTIIDESNNLGSTNNLSISIDTIANDLGEGDYQFAILNTDNNIRIPFSGYQNEPLFENLEGGIYQIIVNDKNGCSPDTNLLVSVIQFPKFFTPNGDGQNDTWVVKGADKTFYPNASINIFNRFGKLVAQIPIESDGWNGTYDGKFLPSDDYWYNITLVPADTTKPTINKRGNFSLIRK